MDKIKNECVDSEYERYLNSMINIKGWRDASTILCDNLECEYCILPYRLFDKIKICPHIYRILCRIGLFNPEHMIL